MHNLNEWYWENNVIENKSYKEIAPDCLRFYSIASVKGMRLCLALSKSGESVWVYDPRGIRPTSNDDALSSIRGNNNNVKICLLLLFLTSRKTRQLSSGNWAAVETKHKIISMPDLRNALNKHATGLPMTHGLRVFDALEPKVIPFKFVLCVELTL